MKHSITIEINDESLDNYTDEYIAQCWHVAQANPAPHTDRDAGALAESIGREIIRRWLAKVPPELYRHQGNSYYWDIARQAGKWVDGKWTPNDQLPEAMRRELVAG